MPVPADGEECADDAVEESGGDVGGVVHSAVEAGEGDQQRDCEAGDDGHPSEPVWPDPKGQ